MMTLDEFMDRTDNPQCRVKGDGMKTRKPWYPHVVIDTNCSTTIALRMKCFTAMRNAGMSNEEISDFDDATHGVSVQDCYDVVRQWFTVEQVPA